MMMKVFCVFDSKVKAFMTPFFCRTSGEAERSFTDAVNREGSGFKTHAEDYTLFEVGAWDDSTCKWELLDTPHAMCKALNVIKEA